jgi:hypothetical protein
MNGLNDRIDRLMADIPPERRRHYEVAFLAILLLLPISLASSPLIFNDGDVSWHVAAGKWILAHRAVPSVDPFSFTFGGKPWVAFEWLSQVIYASAFALAGYGGLSAVVTLALVLLNLKVMVEARRWLSPPVVAAVMIALNIALAPFVLARPHVMGWALLALWLGILLRAREAGRAPPLGWALLMCLWINLHGSWALGMALAAAFALEAMIDSQWDRKQLRDWLLFGLLALAAAAVNANGLVGLLHPLTVARFEHLPLIEEWRPSNPTVTPFFYGLLLATLVLMWWRGIRLGIVRALILAGMLGLALMQVRHQAPLAIVAAMLLPSSFAAAREGKHRGALFVTARERRLVPGIGAAGLIALLIGRMAMPIAPEENGSNPRGLIAAAPAELRERAVLNGYSFGGPLILAGIKPFIDGRSDMYGDAFVSDYKKISEGDAEALQRAVVRWDIAWTMTPRKSDKLLALLDKSPRWKRVYTDKVGVIHVRRDTPSASGSPRGLRAGR